MARVWHYDGTSGVRHAADLTAEAEGFTLRRDTGEVEQHLWADLVHVAAGDGSDTFALRNRRGWRIGFMDPPPPELVHRLPNRPTYGGWIDRIGLTPAIGAFAVLSAFAVFVVLRVPQMLAPLIPSSFEQKLGDAMVGDFGGRICNGPGGQAALDALAARIEPKRDGLKIRVANIDMVNAVALPGGTIMVFDGLLKEAKSPDELAGVIGHEIGHVRNHDVMQSLLRQLGLSVLLGGADSNVGGTLNTLIASSYSRDAESSADRYAINALEKAQISPNDTAAFFARMGKAEESLGKAGAALGYLASHPLSDSRERAFHESAKPNFGYSPALSQAQWQAIVNSCRNDPDVEGSGGLIDPFWKDDGGRGKD